jgi:hypothetical protein
MSSHFNKVGPSRLAMITGEKGGPGLDKNRKGHVRSIPPPHRNVHATSRNGPATVNAIGERTI